MEQKLTPDLKKKLLDFVQKSDADLVTTYLYYLEEKNQIHPVLFPKEKKIYMSASELVDILEKKHALWRETEIQVQAEEISVTDETKKIYICPFTGKVFANNLYPNPEDAIYDWVANCPENKEQAEGVKAKRFLVSDDPEVIRSYLHKSPGITKKRVFSSVITGKLFHSKEGVIEDFKKNQIKALTLHDVQNQNRFELEAKLVQFLQDELTEDKIALFIEKVSEDPSFQEYIQKWLG